MVRSSSQFSTIDPHEIENFAAMAEDWWNAQGALKPLHKLNPIRLDYIKQAICDHFNREKDSLNPFEGIKLLDVGCGGGLVCEPMSRLGATVTGLDATEQSIQIAKKHAAQSLLSIDYQHRTIEEIAMKKAKYDVVLALEIIEHVADIPAFIQSCFACLKKDGLIIFSTLNRTSKSYALGIIAAEYILRWVPRGTHQWKRFVKPSELVRHIHQSQGRPLDLCGLVYNPLNDSFALNKKDVAVNYFMTATH